jgi:N utilization substance protein B
LQLDESATAFARLLACGVVKNLDFVNSNITLASTHWSLSRMSRVDRNILRMAVYELAFLDDIPGSVTINEAIEVAKRYGSADSPMFVNGVLDKVATIFSEHPEQLKKYRAA